MNRRQLRNLCLRTECIDAFQFTFRSCKCYTAKNNACRRVRDECFLHESRINRSHYTCTFRYERANVSTIDTLRSK